MSQMFCFQCQQTAGNKCCVQTGVCGKQPETANLQDELVCGLIRLAETAGQQGARTEEISRLLIDGLFTTLTNVNFDDEAAISSAGWKTNEKSWADRIREHWSYGGARRISSHCAPHCFSA